MNEQSETYTAWQGPAWSLQIMRHTADDGSTSQTAYIDHPGAVVLVPLATTEPEPVLLVLRQYRASLNRIILELPAGTRGWKEPWLSCAQRELREETGYRAARFESLGNCWPAPGLSNEIMALFLALELTEDALPQDQDEHIEVVPIPLAELVAMAIDGELMDAKSVVAILRTAFHLQLLGSSLAKK